MHRWTQARLGSLTAAAALAVVGTTAVAAAAPPGAYDRPGKNERVSVASNGAQGNDFADGSMDITRDGRYVVFGSVASNLVPGDTNTIDDVFRKDRKTGRTVRVSVASDGSQALKVPGQGNLQSGSTRPSVSADGRYVAFTSIAVNLVPGDTNLAGDVFVRDLWKRKTVRASVASNGAQANGGSDAPSISADGRYVAFASDARNLVPGGADFSSVYVHDMKTGKTVLLPVTSRGAQANSTSFAPSISANGRYVAFQSFATNLVPGQTTQQMCQCVASDVFVHDMKTRKNLLVSVASDGAQASFDPIPSCVVGVPPLADLPVVGPVLGLEVQLCSTYPGWPHAISGDGRYVTFYSNATNLVPNDSNYNPALGSSGWDVFVHDIKTGRTERVSVDSYARQRSVPNQGSPHISGDGRYVSYRVKSLECLVLPGVGLPSTGACDVGIGLGPAGTLRIANPAWDSYVYDRLSGAMEQTNLSKSGKNPQSGTCSSTGLLPVRSTDAGLVTPGGRYVLLYSTAPDLVAGDTNNSCDVFVRDRGPHHGVGGFSGGSGSSPGPDETCVSGDVCLPTLSTVDSSGDVRAPLAAQGADLIGSRVVPRPALGDLFVRLDLARMPTVSGSPSGGLLYGLAFTAGGERYEVRAQRVPGADYDAKGGASFGLFRQDPTTGLFTKVASLKGGYGTTGASVVVTVPTQLLGAGQRLADVRAFTAFGSYDVGVTRLLDSIRLSR